MEARLVCFETSGAFGGIAFLLGKKTWEIKFSAEKAYSSHLFRLLPLIFQSNLSERALPTPFPLEEADYFVVDVGPGSFTGLRVGLSLVKALTLIHEKPVIPITSLEVLSFGYGCPDLPILSLVDAYTGEVFAGLYRWEKGRLTTLLEPYLLRLEELESLIQEKTLIVSETLDKWKDYLSERLSHKVVFPSNPIELSASLLGRLAMLKLSQGEAKVLSGDEVLPLYLKPSQAERKRS
ncbi:MAG: tRNA (adenosine(37)-N6)-threonylcarbamoyltransferase complex dimerization subunit type 1 TsaB [Caldimicrobium sp.]|nr:tRNA (adenosine(37)-N6)-threonylcarbamoyltransferase complex dimerization subunit type 1 TsaB [Caldimicrobium sp.]